MSFIVAALIISAQASVDVQQPATVPAPVAAASQEAKKPKLICKREDPDSGSRMSKRTCKTAEEWNGDVGSSSSRAGMSMSGEAYSQGH